MNNFQCFLTLILGLNVLVGCAGQSPANLGLRNGKLLECPESPNCVVSQHPDQKHFIKPIDYSTSPQEALEKLRKMMATEKRVQIIENKDYYIRVEFTSALFGFVDDVEFYFPNEPLIHVRSASRLGYSDLGQNRKRIEKIRTHFNNP